MKNARLWSSVGLLLCVVIPASGAVITIDGTSNIFGTSQGGGTDAPYISFSPGSVLSVGFSAITGTVDCDGAGAFCVANGAEGSLLSTTQGATGTNISPAAGSGLSGINYIGRVMFLTGVFLTDAAPSGANPGNFLTYTNSLASGASFSPGLGQLFFIGDGQGTGGTQAFVVPTGASRLYLGFADGAPLFGSSGSPGTPGAYSDNSGQLSATYELELAPTEIPEPASVLLMGVGMVALGLLRRKRA